MSKGAKSAIQGGKKAGIDVVAEDRNWVDRIQNELNCASVWTKDWLHFLNHYIYFKGIFGSWSPRNEFGKCYQRVYYQRLN